MTLPPGPRTPRLVQAARVTAEPYRWMAKCRERYGDVFSSHFPFYGRIVYVAEPALVKQVFTGDPDVFHAGEANATALGDSLGENSLLTLDEGRHMSQRKLLLPPFHGQAVRRYVETMAAAAAAEVERWPVGTAFSLRPRMQAITLDVILRAVFGVRDGERMDLFRRHIPRLGEFSSVLDWLPFMQRELGGLTPAARFRKALAAVDELLYAEIAERRVSDGAQERDDVLSLLLTARHENGSPMSDVELRDELLTLLTAGHETTATGLAWTFERLLRTPAAMGRLLESLDDDDYLDAVVKEALRVRPVVVDVARKLTREIELAGWRLPAGTLVLPAIAAIHMRPDLYPQPEQFRPERFVDGGAESYARERRHARHGVRLGKVDQVRHREGTERSALIGWRGRPSGPRPRISSSAGARSSVPLRSGAGGISRPSGLGSSRIDSNSFPDTPSTVAWWIFVSSATRPPSSPWIR